MKKTLSLLAILGLLLVSSVFAAAPTFPDIPDVKLFVGQGLTPAFDLAAFNTGDAATAYSIVANPLNLSSLSTSVVSYGSYGLTTVYAFTYRGVNDGGQGDANNKIKYSTFKIGKLPKFGLNVGNYVDVNVGAKVTGTGFPLSFGNTGAVIVSDLSKVTATWQNSSVLRVQLNNAITAPVYVDVIASQIATGVFGANIDKERIEVYPNLLTGGSQFTAGSDTAAYFYQNPNTGGLGSIGWLASKADGAGTVANGVMTFSVGVNQGVKATILAPYWLSYQTGQYYIARMKVCANVNDPGLNGFEADLWNWNGVAPNTNANPSHVVANLIFGVPTTWTWIEAPIKPMSIESGYLQIFAKTGASSQANVLNIDEVQIINAKPSLISASNGVGRGNIAAPFAPGTFDTYASYTANWVNSPFSGVAIAPTQSVSNGKLALDFTGASTSSLKGAKFTFGVPGTAGTLAAGAAGTQVGIKYDLAVASGSFNSVAALHQVIILGTATNISPGSQTFFSVEGTAEFGSASGGAFQSGTFEAVGMNQWAPYYQVQFANKNEQAGVLTIDNIKVLVDNDDPFFGDMGLFP